MHQKSASEYFVVETSVFLLTSFFFLICCSSYAFAIEEIDSTLRIGLSENSADGLEISQPILQSTVLGDTFSQSCDAHEKFEMVPEFR